MQKSFFFFLFIMLLPIHNHININDYTEPGKLKSRDLSHVMCYPAVTCGYNHVTCSCFMSCYQDVTVNNIIQQRFNKHVGYVAHKHPEFNAPSFQEPIIELILQPASNKDNSPPHLPLSA